MQEGLQKGKGKKSTRETSSKLLDKEKLKNKKAEKKSETAVINGALLCNSSCIKAPCTCKASQCIQ